MSERYDLLIRGATVYDGTGRPPVVADVGVAGDRIGAVGDLAAAGETVSASTVVDGHNLAVAPGFIDVHSHDDVAVLVDGDIACKLLQGVTTEVVGNCGLGVAPYAQALDVFAPWSPGIEAHRPWDGYGDYLDRLDESPPSVNIAVLVGHGSVRGAVVGNAAGAPSAAELSDMQALVREGMAAGAVGFSTGLIYEPGRYADTEEVIALAGEAAAAGGIYTTHMRNEGDQLLEAVGEAIRIGEEAGLAVEISHHKASGRANWGKVHESLAMVDGARQRGLRVTLDQYPYTAGSTHLYAVVQNGALDGGGGGIGVVEPHNVRIASAVGHPEWEGLNLVQVGEGLGVSPRKAADLVIEQSEGSALVVIEMMSEDDVRTVMRHPCTMIGTDGVVAPGKQHPRAWGTFPRILGRYVRDEGVLTLEEAVRRMTSLPASTFGLADRGVVREGAFADLVVFDPATVADTATYDDPNQPPTGIALVVVNGTVVARDGVHAGTRPGGALRRTGPIS